MEGGRRYGELESRAEGRQVKWSNRSAAVLGGCPEGVPPAAPRARRPFGKLRAGSRDSRQDAGATIYFARIAAISFIVVETSMP